MRRFPLLALTLVGCGVAAGSPTVTPVVSFRDFGIVRDFTTVPDLTQPQDLTSPPPDLTPPPIQDLAGACPGDMAPPADLAHGTDLLAPPSYGATSGNVSGVVVPEGGLYVLTGDVDVPNGGSFTAGVYPGKRCVIIGNGHRFTSTNHSGTIAIRNCFITNLGGTGDESAGGSALSFHEVSSGSVMLDHNKLDNIGQVYVLSSASSTATVSHNEFGANSKVEIGPENVNSVYVQSFKAEGSSSARSYFQGNTVLRSGPSFYSANWTVGGYSEGEGNILVAHRGAVRLYGHAGLIYAGNYTRPLMTATTNPDVENIAVLGGDGLDCLAEHNVIRNGQWNLRGIPWETRYNWIVERVSHCMACSAVNVGTKLHHNIFWDSWQYGANQEGVAEQIYAVDGFEAYNNTINGFVVHNPGEASDAPFLHLYDGAVLASVRSNAVHRMVRAAAAITRRYPGGLGPASGGPGDSRLLYADYNLFSLSAGVGTFNGILSIASNYGHGLAEQVWLYPSTATVAHCTASPSASDCITSARCTERSGPSGSCGAWGTHDATALSGVLDQQVDPLVTGPFLSDPVTHSYAENPNVDQPTFPFCNAAIIIRAPGNEVSDMLAYARSVESPATSSPLVNGGDPADGTGNMIGAIGPGACGSAPGDNFGCQLNQVPRILLTEARLTKIRAAASGVTAQWTAFKATLDALLDVVIPGSYQGDVLEHIANFAVGYQALRFSDPVQASKYADKAISIITSGLQDYQQLSYSALLRVGRGDGANRDFVIPNADFHTSTLQVLTCPVTSWANTRRSDYLWDEAGSPFAHTGFFFDRVANTSSTTAAASFTKGIDWKHATGDDHLDKLIDTSTGGRFWWNNQIDWSIGGSKPANGATYYMQGCSYTDVAPTAAWTRVGTTVTFTVAPSASTIVFMSYTYGTSDRIGRTLNYQQTSANEGGGLASVQVDSGYTTRYLKFVAFGLDALDGYIGLSGPLKARITAQLLTWYSYNRQYGYAGGDGFVGRCDLASNYGVGNFAMLTWTAVALERRSGWDGFGPNHAGDMADFYRSCGPARLTGAAPSIAGGEWAGGIGYGQQATRSLIATGLGLDSAGWTVPSDIHTWANQVIEATAELSPTQSSFYDVGDIFGSPPSPASFPGKDFLYFAVAGATDATDKAIGNYMIQTYPGAQTAEWADLLLRDPAASTTNVNTLPLAKHNVGPGVVVARKAWDWTGTMATLQLGTPLYADHEAFAAGFIELWRGADRLIIHGPYDLQDFDIHTKSSRLSVVAIDDNGDGIMFYPFNQHFWWGAGAPCAGEQLQVVDLSTDYDYASGDYANSYCNNAGTNVVSTLRRDWLYDRVEDKVLVHDVVVPLVGTYKQQLRWYVQGDPTLSGDTWSVAQGGSKLFAATFSNVTLATTKASLTGNGVTIHQIISQPTGSSVDTRYWTALQPAASGVGAMDTTANVSETSGNMDCLRTNLLLACFRKVASALPTTETLSYTAPAGAVTHRMTGMQPSRAYTLTGDNSGHSATSTGQGVLTFASNAAGTVTVH